MWSGAFVLAALVAGAEPAADPTAATTSASATPTAPAATAAATPTPAATATVQRDDEDEGEPEPQVAPASANLAPAPPGVPLSEARPIVLSRREWSDGGALERLIEPSGDLVLHAVSPAGTVLSCTRVGSLFALPVVAETDAAGGEIVEVVRDESGALLRFVVQPDGEARAVALVEPAPRG